jgi:hypothetical protein
MESDKMCCVFPEKKIVALLKTTCKTHSLPRHWMPMQKRHPKDSQTYNKKVHQVLSPPPKKGNRNQIA